MNQPSLNPALSTPSSLSQQHKPAKKIAHRFYYRVGNHTILLEKALTTEVFLDLLVAPLPFAPHWCKGLSNLRSDLLPVVDLHQLLLKKSVNQHYFLYLKHPKFPPVILSCDDYPKAIELDDNLINQAKQNNNNVASWLTPYHYSSGKTSSEKELLIADHEILLKQLQQQPKSEMLKPMIINE